MNIFLYHLTFVIFSIFIFIRTVSFAIYEMRTQNNKFGGIVVIVFSLIVVIFTNILVFLR